MGKYVIYKENDGQYLFDLKSGNGNIILTSVASKTRAACKKIIDKVRKTVKFNQQFIRLESEDGKSYFNLTTEEGVILAKSKMYDSKSLMENGIDSIKKNAPRAKL